MLDHKNTLWFQVISVRIQIQLFRLLASVKRTPRFRRSRFRRRHHPRDRLEDHLLDRVLAEGGRDVEGLAQRDELLRQLGVVPFSDCRRQLLHDVHADDRLAQRPGVFVILKKRG